MDFTFLLDGKYESLYECSRDSGIAYSTLSDLMHGKTPIDRATMRTAYYLASILGITMEELYDQMHVPERTSLETFKSQVRHDIKRLGDTDFISVTDRRNLIMKYWHFDWYYESLYLLAMIDYLCRINNLTVIPRYDEIRNYSLPDISYPSDILLAARLNPAMDIRKKAIAESIPEFIRFNIVEKDIRNVY